MCYNVDVTLVMLEVSTVSEFVMLVKVLQCSQNFNNAGLVLQVHKVSGGGPASI